MICKTNGIAILPIVQALRADETVARSLLAPELIHYLSDHIVPTNWYPDADWIELLRALARIVPPENAPLGPYVMFGRLAALRDLADNQNGAPIAARTETGGVYRQLITGPLDPVSWMRRMTKVWSLYHDTGVAELLRDPSRPNVITYRLNDYPLATREVFEINRGYAEQYGSLVGTPCEVISIEPTPGFEHSWSMEVQFTETPVNVGSIPPIAPQ